MTLQKTGMRLIGKAPTHIDESDLLDYFLYVFEFSWNCPVFEEKKATLDEYFIERAKSFYPDYESFSLSKQWWLYILIAMKDVTEDQQLKYGITTVDYLISRLPVVSERMLEDQINEIQNAFYDEIPDVMLVRPMELEVLENSTIQHDMHLPFFIENKEHFVKVFEKHLRQKDIDKEYFERFTMTNTKRLRKFSTFWEGYYEIFINYFISLYDFRMPQEMESIEEEYDLLEELVTLFLVASIINKPKIEEVVDEITEILKDFVAQNGKWDS
jgi:hypothetical protein